MRRIDPNSLHCPPLIGGASCIAYLFEATPEECPAASSSKVSLDASSASSSSSAAKTATPIYNVKLAELKKVYATHLAAAPASTKSSDKPLVEVLAEKVPKSVSMDRAYRIFPARMDLSRRLATSLDSLPWPADNVLHWGWQPLVGSWLQPSSFARVRAL